MSKVTKLGKVLLPALLFMPPAFASSRSSRLRVKNNRVVVSSIMSANDTNKNKNSVNPFDFTNTKATIATNTNTNSDSDVLVFLKDENILSIDGYSNSNNNGTNTYKIFASGAYCSTDAMCHISNGGPLMHTQHGQAITCTPVSQPNTVTCVVASDTTPPTLSNVTFTSSNSSNTKAKEGDTVTLAFTASENINTPTVTIAGHSVTPSGSGTSWSATYTMASGDAEGVVAFTIDYSDTSSNAGTQVTTTANSSTVTYDKTAPTLSSVENSSITTTTATIKATPNEACNLYYKLSTSSTPPANSEVVSGADGSSMVLANVAKSFDLTSLSNDTQYYAYFVSVDASGNMSTVSSTSFTTLAPDTTAPTLSSVSIASNNSDTTKAKIGDLITVTFTASESIGTPTVTIAGQNATISGSGTSWSATYTMTSNESSGAVAFNIAFSDLASNAGVAVTAVTDSTSVTYDGVVPTVTNITRKTPTSQYTNADELVFTVEFSENMTGIDTSDFATNNTASATVTNVSGSGTTYDVTVSGGTLSSLNGVVNCGVNLTATDSVGNAITSATPTGTFETYTVDNTAPTLSTVTFASSNTDTTKAKVGDTITLTITASESISEPTVTIGGHSVTPSGSGTSWSATYTLVEGDTEGNLGFNIAFSDLATNAGTAVTTATSGSSTVAFDKTAPTLSSVSIASNNTDTTKAKIGDTITLTFTSDEAIGTPTVSIGGHAITDEDLTSVGNVWTAVYVAQSGDSDLGISIAFSDLASNAGTTVTATTDSTSVSFDGTAPTVTSTSPADNATEVATSSDFTITFDENVTRGSGDILLRANSIGFVTVETISVTDTTKVTINGNVVTINPTANLSTSTSYAIQIASTAFTDASGNAYAGITDDSTWSFTSSSIVSAPLLTVTNNTAGSVDNSTKLTATPASGNVLKYKVSSTSITTPNVGDTPTGLTAYTSDSDITGVDRTTNKYVGVYELDSSGNVVKFALLTLTKSEINMPSAPALSATASTGTANRTTKVTATAGSGNTLAYKVSSTTIATPDVGDVPTDTTAYTSGSDISGVDATTNKYLGMYELDSNGEVVNFKLITLTNSEINLTSAPALTATASKGTANKTTKVTATASSGNTLAYKVSSTSIATPIVGDTTTGTTAYTSGSDISGVDATTNKYLAMYELDSNGGVVKFKLITLTDNEINIISAPTLTATASKGTANKTTKVTATASSGNTLAYKVSSTSIATPIVGDVPTGTTAYTSGSDIGGVDATTNKYLAMYELDSNGGVVKFKLITLTNDEINIISAPTLTAIASKGSEDNTTKVTATAESGNTLAYKVSSTSIDTPMTGDTPTGTTAYTSEDDISGVDRTTNKYLGIYELDSSGNVVKFKQFTLTKEEINMPTASLLNATASKGSAIGTTKVSASADTNNTLVYKVSDIVIDTPDVGDEPTDTTEYTSEDDISGVDATINKYLAMYELDSNDEVVKFALLTLTDNEIKSDTTDDNVTYTINNSYKELVWDTIRASNVYQQNVTTNLTLITSDKFGSTISWSSSDTAVATAEGAITLLDAQGDVNEKTIVLKATITKDGETKYKYFFITVPKAGLTDAQKVEFEINNVSFDDIRLNNMFTTQIISDLNLSLNSLYGTSLSWDSSDTNTIATNGVVTRGASDANVTLTVTSTLNSETKSKVFALIVKATLATDEDAVAKDKALLSPLKILGKNRDVDHIIYDLSLMTTGENGTTISWSSSDTDVLSDAGILSTQTRTEDKIVKLTATITKGDASSTITYQLKVLKTNTTDLINTIETDATFKNLSEDEDTVNNNKVITAQFDENSATVNNTITVSNTHQVAVVTDLDAVKTTVNIDTSSVVTKINALTTYQNANGTFESKIQFSSDNDDEINLASITSKVTGTNTTIDNKGNLAVSTVANGSTLTAEATSSGVISHTVVKNGATSKASTSIKNSSVNIGTDGSVETDSTVTIGNIIYRAVAITDANNKTITRFEAYNTVTKASQTIAPTLKSGVSEYDAGATVDIIQNSDGSVTIQTLAPLSGSIIIE